MVRNDDTIDPASHVPKTTVLTASPVVVSLNKVSLIALIALN